MKALLASTTAIVALAVGPAFAADLPLKAPGAAPAYYNWSGLYIGGQGGGTWRGQYDWGPQFPSVSSDLDGGFAGGTVGWNWYASKWVVIGIEADWSWADIKGDFKGGAEDCNTKVAWEAS